jgi:predicted ATP-dependent serine protease
MNINTRVDNIPFGTNVQTIEIPKKLQQRISTGVSYVDCVLGGVGFTPSMVTYLTGVAGGGKTTMALEIANGLAKNNAIAVFNSCEESPYQVGMRTKRLGLRNTILMGQESNMKELIEKCEKLRKSYKNKDFFLIIDSLQCMHDGKFSTGRITSQTAERALAMITDWCKENYTNAIVIGQVNKSGVMSGSNKLKHMVDAHLHIDIEKRDKELEGCRILEAQKNRFGGTGNHVYLDLHRNGFTEIARITS